MIKFKAFGFVYGHDLYLGGLGRLRIKLVHCNADLVAVVAIKAFVFY